MKILVTGGAGFIGSHICDAYLNLGHEVTIIDNLSTGREDNINKKAKFFNVDIRDKEKIEEIFTQIKPDIINHHAAQVNVTKSVDDPSYDASVNVLGSLNLLASSKKHKVKKFIYGSTGGAVYGYAKELPVYEEYPINPICAYGITKHTIEHYLYLYNNLYNLPYTVLRYANIYGPRQDPHGEAGVVAIFSIAMLRGITPTIFGDGTKTRDYVYASDVVAANVKTLEKGNNKICNIGLGKEISDLKIFETIRDELGINLEPNFSKKRPGEIDRISLDASKAKECLNWNPKVELKEGIKLAVDFYKKNHDKYSI